MCNNTGLMAQLDKPAAPMDAAEEEFSGRLVTMVNHATLGLMISIGHRTGLFEALKASGPATSRELADHAGLDERYVREWLGAMTTGRIMELDRGRAHAEPDLRARHMPPVRVAPHHRDHGAASLHVAVGSAAR